MAGTVTEGGDIVAPLDETDWEALRCQADWLPTLSD